MDLLGSHPAAGAGSNSKKEFMNFPEFLVSLLIGS
jgi:hypothetical protein